MNVIEAIEKRHSFRGSYKPDPVPKKKEFGERAWFNKELKGKVLQ